MKRDEGNKLPAVVEQKNAVRLAIPEGAPPMPSLVIEGGVQAHYAYEEFFYGELARNKNTQRAYLFAVRRFLEVCEDQGLALPEVRPGHVSTHIHNYPASDKTKKVHLSAIRRFFDKLVERHAVVLNPASSVKGPKVVVTEGLTPDIGLKFEHQLLDAIDTSHLVGLRDYCIIGTMIGTAVRRGAISKLDVRHLRDTGAGFEFLFHEKGGKHRTIPVRSDLLPYLQRYLKESGINDKTPPPKKDFWPLFRSTIGRTKKLSANPFQADDMGAMVNRRLFDAGLGTRKTVYFLQTDGSRKSKTEYASQYSPHSFRVTTLTDLCSQEGIQRSDVQNFAGHSDPRTTQLYDRTSKEVTRNLVERISTKLDR